MCMNIIHSRIRNYATCDNMDQPIGHYSNAIKQAQKGQYYMPWNIKGVLHSFMLLNICLMI